MTKELPADPLSHAHSIHTAYFPGRAGSTVQTALSLSLDQKPRLPYFSSRMIDGPKISALFARSLSAPSGAGATVTGVLPGNVLPCGAGPAERTYAIRSAR